MGLCSHFNFIHGDYGLDERKSYQNWKTEVRIEKLRFEMLVSQEQT